MMHELSMSSQLHTHSLSCSLTDTHSRSTRIVSVPQPHMYPYLITHSFSSLYLSQLFSRLREQSCIPNPTLVVETRVHTRLVQGGECKLHYC
jgi:hypothetical protein